jgi:hypothetical protein
MKAKAKEPHSEDPVQKSAEFEEASDASPIGLVQKVAGSRVTGALTTDGVEKVRLGTILRTPCGASSVYGIVSNMAARDLNSAEPQAGGFFDMDLIGESVLDASGSVSFQRGVSMHPKLNGSVFKASAEDLALIYAKPNVPSVSIGTLHFESRLPAYLITDDLLGKHCAIVGTTGSGKSSGLAVIVRSLIEHYPHAHVVILDPHDEYAAAFSDTCELITAEDLDLPYWLLNFEEMKDLMCSQDPVSRETEASILREAVEAAKREYLEGRRIGYPVKVDTPVPYWLSRVLRSIREAMGRLDRPGEALPYLRLKSRLEALQNDRRYAFMFSNVLVKDTMAEILSRFIRLPEEGKPISVLSMAGMPSEIVNLVVSVLGRLIFDFSVWRDQARELPILLVCEEAHRYIPRNPYTAYQPVKNIISRIAKEGRKYGFSLALISQRPSELDETVLSQCGTLLAMRLSNERDQELLARALPDNSPGLLASLPVLRTREAVVAGEGVSMPMRFKFKELLTANRPKGKTVSFAENWGEEFPVRDHVPETVDRWRRQVK